MSLKDSLAQSLQQLASACSEHGARSRLAKRSAERVFGALYRAGRRAPAHCEAERQRLGALLAAAIRPLQVSIESTACADRTRLTNAVLIKRSAIQFLIDNYADCPVGDTTLAQELKKANIEGSVEILDRVIHKWWDVSDSDEGCSDRGAAGANVVPSSHTWWHS